MIWQHYAGVTLHPRAHSTPKRRYSVTADILAYKLCPIQYNQFAIRKYEPALVVQLFFGTVVHQVLDWAHSHYRGLMGHPLGTMPTDADIQGYFDKVVNVLKSRQIRATQNVRDFALDVVQRFNRIEGPVLYPRVKDTECRLQSDRGQYILHGNVDVLAHGEDNEQDVEIWDYKGVRAPSRQDPDYDQYVYQMQVYAELYFLRTGVYPKKAMLYFLNELEVDPNCTTRPVNAIIEVNLDRVSIDTAMRDFGDTVLEIERCRANRQWPNPVNPPQKTCDACDLRWNCSAARALNRSYTLMYP